MNVTEMTEMIYGGVLRFLPLLRIAWGSMVGMGAVMIIIALVLKKNPDRRKSPWIVGGIGLLMVISSGTQLISSLI